MIAERLNEFIRSGKVPPPDDSLVARAMKEFGDALDAFGQRQTWRIRPSGQKCVRAEAFEKLGIVTDHDPESEGVFFAGKMGEIWTFHLMELAGLHVHGRHAKVTIPSAHGDVLGEIDGVVTLGEPPNHKDYLLDVKTSTAIGFRNIETELATGGDPWGYKRQLKAYMMGMPSITGGILLYMTKEYWHTWAEVVVPEPSEKDRELWDAHVGALLAVKDEGTLPPRPEWAEGSLVRRPRAKDLEIGALQCRYCDCVRACWGDVGNFIRVSHRTYRAFSS